MMNERMTWADSTRGIAIILVVIGHVISNLSSSGLLEIRQYEIVKQIIYSFHMPLFFFVSGYLLAIKENEGAYSRIYILNRFITIGIPYVIFSFMYWFCKFIFSGAVNNPVQITDLMLIFISPIGEYWFLYTLLILNIIRAVIYRMDIQATMCMVVGLVLVLVCQ